MTYPNKTVAESRPIVPVSVIIPAYGHADFITHTLDSVLAQTVAPAEIIVVNDGSPDDTEARLKPYMDQGTIRYLHQANSGQAAARNRGAAMASAEFITFLDDDDLLPPDSLEWRLARLTQDPELDLVCGSHHSFTGAPPVASTFSTEGGDRTIELTFAGLLVGNPMISPGQALMRRSAFDRVGGFAPAVWGADDWDLWFRLAAHGRLLMLQRVALLYRLHQANASRHVVRLCTNIETVLRTHLSATPGNGRRAYAYKTWASVASRWTPDLLAFSSSALPAGRWKDAAAGLLVAARFNARRWSAALLLKSTLVRKGRWRLDPPSM